MTANEKAFRDKLDTLTTPQILALIDETWDTFIGGDFRAWGFDIIWDRLGEDESDRLYDEMWRKHHAA